MSRGSHSRSSPAGSTLYIFGAGGSGRETAWLARQCYGNAVSLVHLVDQAKYLSAPVNGISVQLLSDTTATPDGRFVVALGDSSVRRAAASSCENIGLTATVLVHPRAEISELTSLDPGVLICAGCVVTTNVRLGQHVHVNIGCTLSHDVVIDSFSTLSPGVHVAGHVHIGRDVLVGTGANIINGCADKPLIVGDGAVVAAGACVTKSVEPGALVAGVPATRRR